MRNLLLILLTVFCTCRVCAAANVTFCSADEKKEAVKRATLTIRMACISSWQGMPMADGHREAADTLTTALYTDTLPLPLAYQVTGRLTAESYRLIVCPDKADTKAMREAINSCHKLDKFHDNFFVNCAMAVAYKARKDGDRTLAALYFIRSLKALRTMWGDKANPLAERCTLHLAYIARENGDFNDEALWWMSNMLIAKDLHGIGSVEFNESAEMVAVTLPFMTDRDKARGYYSGIMSLFEKEGLTDTPTFFSLLAGRAGMAADDGDSTKATEMYDRLLDIMTTEYQDFVAITAAISAYFQGQRDYPRMMRAFNMSLDAFSEGHGSVQEFSSILTTLNAPVCDATTARRTLEVVRKRVGDSRDLADRCTLAMAMSKAGEIDGAYALATSVRADYLAGRHGPDTTAEDATTSDIITAMFSALGDIDSAIEFLKLSIPATKRVYDDIDPSISRSMEILLADYLHMNGEHSEALHILSLHQTDSTLTSKERYRLTRSMMTAKIAMGNYEEAVIMADSLLASLPAPSEAWPLLTDKASALVCLVDVAYSDNHDLRETALNELDRTVERLRQLCDSSFSSDPEIMAMQQIYSATKSFLANDDKGMLAAADKARGILNSPGVNPRTAADYISSLSMYYVKAGLYDQAEETLLTPAVTDTELSIERLFRRQLQSEIAFGRGDTREARRLYMEHCTDITSMVREHFTSLTSAERAGYWRMFSQQIQNAGRYAKGTDGPSEFAATVYDLELFSKGLLLNSEHAIDRLISDTGDQALIGKYSMFRNISRSLKNAGTLSETERSTRIEHAARLEREILESCREYGDFTTRLSSGWHDIYSVLNDNEIAVEFVRYDDLERNHFIGATVLTPRLNLPVFIPLGEEAEIARSIEEDFDGSPLWDPISPYIPAGGKIYFSPAGYLHRLPVESCCPDSISAYRLSSTRMLLDRNSPTRLTTGGCAIFGGLDYGDTPPVATVGAIRDGEGYLSPLPGTLAELQVLSTLWPGNDHVAISGKEGTKNRFMELPHGEISLLHIGTHGYFDNTPANGTSSGLFASGSVSPVSMEDRSLRSCGLFFAGANNTIHSNHDDSNSRVNSEEISALDFRGRDLAVLSACETAAGEVTGEGVFGLQRGFKLAGARSILMSLWKVDDKATEQLMTEFYTRLLSTPSAGKHAALEAAKASVRAIPEWSDPIYWSGFILLDAID